jgi:NAD(P)-dependent dehydrogenase (short-subunit alcohol dehydrogenase family)
VPGAGYQDSTLIAMKKLEGRVALVTGAAGGIGLGLARRLADEGMMLVLADIDANDLRKVATEIEGRGAQVEAVATDVTERASVEALASRAYGRFGAVDVLCSNAGVPGPPTGWIWDVPPEEWNRVFAVNTFGLVNMLTAFVPRMLSGERDGHIVVTASIQGFISAPSPAQYTASKHAAVSIAETLSLQLDALKSRLRVSILSPGPTATRIMERERMHASRVGRPLEMPGPSREGLAAGDPLRPEQVAAQVVDAIRDERLYVFTHAEEHRRQVLDRARPILASLGVSV